MAERGLELRDFVSTALTEIVAGVQEAQSQVGKHDGYVNPMSWKHHAKHDDLIWYQHGADPGDARYGEKVAFDVAVTSGSRDKAEGGAGIFVAALGVGVKGSEEFESQAVSRIRFTVPLFLPRQKSG